jgi:hypothetical protein
LVVPVYAEAACPPIEDSVEGVAVIQHHHALVREIIEAGMQEQTMLAASTPVLDLIRVVDRAGFPLVDFFAGDAEAFELPIPEKKLSNMLQNQILGQQNP